MTRVLLLGVLLYISGCGRESGPWKITQNSASSRYEGNVLYRMTYRFMNANPQARKVEYRSELVGPFSRRLQIFDASEPLHHLIVIIDERLPQGVPKVLAESGNTSHGLTAGMKGVVAALRGMDRELLWLREFRVEFPADANEPIWIRNSTDLATLEQEGGGWKLSWIY
ncbi:MAG: hypothetical protein U0S12_01045 [Fimbriimonadales bacterium]